MEESALARKTALDILRYFDNIDIEDELEASDIRNLINEIYDFYQKAYAAGINLGNIEKNKFDTLKNAASDIAKAMVILQKDYSDEEDISVLYAFSSNPIGTALPFLEMLRKADKDIDTAHEQMRSEKEALTRKGSWSENIDPRFKQQQKAFETLLSELKEV